MDDRPDDAEISRRLEQAARVGGGETPIVVRVTKEELLAMASAPVLPTIGRIVVYRSKTGKYVVPALVSATVDTLYRPGVDEGHLSDLTDEMHVHLAIFTPGFSGHRTSTTSVAQAEELTRLSTPAGGTYQEFDVPFDESGETPGSWSWPKRS